MKNRFLKAVWILPLGLCLSFALSRGAELEPPKEPILARLPQAASWTVNFKYKSDDGATAGGSAATLIPSNPNAFSDQKRRVTVLKKDRVWNEQILWKSGPTTELWIYENVRLLEQPGTGIIGYKPWSTENKVGFDYRAADFEGLEWISLENYRGSFKYEGKLAYMFEKVPSGGEPISKNDSLTGKWGKNRIVLVSPETRLPLFYYDGFSERTYTYGPAPTAPLVPPEKFMKLFEELKRANQ